MIEKPIIQPPVIVEINGNPYFLEKENRRFVDADDHEIPFDAISLRQADLITKQLGNFEWYTPLS
jgi:hypothetical protein